MLIEKTIKEFNELIDSNTPAPGGGSVSALAGALGVSLARMYGHLSLTKKKFLALEEGTQQQFIEHFTQLEDLSKELMKLVDEDTNAYNCVMEAYKLPKITQDEVEIRNVAIQKANIVAIEIPLKVMNCGLRALELIHGLIPYGNQNAISDVGVGVLLIETGIQGAGLNVKINLNTFEDEKIKSHYQEEMTRIIHEANQLKTAYLTEIHQMIG